MKRNHEWLCNECMDGFMGAQMESGKINTYIAWCNSLCTTAFLHPEGCSARFSLSLSLSLSLSPSLSLSDALSDNAVFSCFCSGQPHQHACTWGSREEGGGNDEFKKLWCLPQGEHNVCNSFQTCVIILTCCSSVCSNLTQAHIAFALHSFDKNADITWTVMDYLAQHLQVCTGKTFIL